jgi:hypothetical protein
VQRSGRYLETETMLENFVKRFSIDNVAATYEVEFRDGTVHRMRAASTGLLTQTAKDFIHVSYDTHERTLTLVAPNGDTFELEVYDGGDELERRAGRPVVYLDQNKWILLACAVQAPDKVFPRSELVPAMRLIDLAEQRRLILPISSGNMLEAAYTDGSQRRHIGRIMLRLSRGWLMTHPLRVRRSELASVLCPSLERDPAREVFTLDPSRFYDSGDMEDIKPSPKTWPDLERLLLETLTGIVAFAATLILEEKLHEEAGVQAATAWANKWQAYAQVLKTNSRARSNARSITKAWFLLDLWTDYVRVASERGVTEPELNQWFEESAETDLAKLPYLGRMREVIHYRLMNAGDRWARGDLVDILYLPYAAAYADVLVAEKKTSHYLISAQRRLGGGARVVTSLAEAVEALDGAA